MADLTDKQREAVEAVAKYGSQRAAAIALGVGRSTLQERLRFADKKQQDPAVQEAMNAIGTEMTPSMVWVKTKGKDGEPGHSVMLRPVVDAGQTFLQMLETAFTDIPAYVAAEIRRESEAPENLTVYPLYDMHIGMMAWARETRGQAYDLELAKQDLIASITTVAADAPAADLGLLVLGGDTLHVNDHFNETPGSKHHMDADGRYEKIVDVAVEAIAYAIEHLATIHRKVSVVILRGNHDETSHIALKAALKQRYRQTEGIEFPSISGWDKSEIYWMKHGKSLIVMHHGDKMPPQRLAMIAADQCEYWSECKHRVVLTGHVHKLVVQDFPGVTHYSLRAFCPSDAYGANFGGRRGLAAMTFSATKGLKNIAMDPIDRAA